MKTKGVMKSFSPSLPGLYVVTRIIEKILQSKDGRLKRTQLQMKSGLNLTAFTKYLNLLLVNGLLAMEHYAEGDYVTATYEGRKTYNALLNSISQVLGKRWMGERRYGV